MNTRNRVVFRLELAAAVVAAAALLGSCIMEEEAPDEVALEAESQEILLDTEQTALPGTESDADEQVTALEDPVPAPLAAPPSCVWTRLDDDGATDYLEVHNDCGYTVRIKVVLAFATDRACQSIPSGTYHWWTWGYPGRFDKLETC